ncbi:MAG: hypothetical protein AAF479_14395 [Pseudomonadota bacterium]
MTEAQPHIAEANTVGSKLKNWTARQGRAVLKSAPVWMPLVKIAIELICGDTGLGLQEALWLMQAYKEAPTHEVNTRNSGRNG